MQEKIKNIINKNFPPMNSYRLSTGEYDEILTKTVTEVLAEIDMDKILELLQRLTIEYTPPENGNHAITLSPGGENLMLHVFHDGQWFSGMLVEPINVEQDIEAVRQHIESTEKPEDGEDENG